LCALAPRPCNRRILNRDLDLRRGRAAPRAGGVWIDALTALQVAVHADLSSEERMDIAAATGRVPVLTSRHDGTLIADVATEWAGRHGQPCTLRLTGPAGGSFEFGVGGPAFEIDATQFCRILAGRAAGDGLLGMPVPF